MKTFSYIYGTIEEIEIDKGYYFGQLWDGNGGNGEGKKLLEDGTISPDNENVVEFEIVEPDEDIMKTLVKVTCIR